MVGTLGPSLGPGPGEAGQPSASSLNLNSRSSLLHTLPRLKPESRLGTKGATGTQCCSCQQCQVSSLFTRSSDALRHSLSTPSPVTPGLAVRP